MCFLFINFQDGFKFIVNWKFSPQTTFPTRGPRTASLHVPKFAIDKKKKTKENCNGKKCDPLEIKFLYTVNILD